MCVSVSVYAYMCVWVCRLTCAWRTEKGIKSL